MKVPTKTQLKALKAIQGICHENSYEAGWWHSQNSKKPVDQAFNLRLRNPYGLLVGATKISLIHSEISEALEGFRKDKKDEHLPQHPSVGVELADAIIRILDLAGAMGLDLPQMLADKIAYNISRPDHKKENRAKIGGKAI